MKYLFLLLCLMISFSSLSQNKKDKENKKEKGKPHDVIEKDQDLEHHLDPTIELNPNKKKKEKDKKLPKKKKKKKEYYNVKVSKRFTKNGSGKKLTIEKFTVLKTYTAPSKFSHQKFFYNFEKRKIEMFTNMKKVKEEEHEVLHGRYIKTVNGQIVQRGFFYKGVKHGTWEFYKSRELTMFDEEEDKNGKIKQIPVKETENILISKVKYHKGFPKDSKMSYHDGGMTKIKSITPIINGKKQGMHFEYYESGRVAVQGEYKDGVKVGKWNEYYDKPVRRNKRIIYYRKRPTDPFKEEVVSEWDKKGKKIK